MFARLSLLLLWLLLGTMTIIVLWLVYDDPPPCNSGMIGMEVDPNIIRIIHNSHYYWVGGST